MACRAGITTRPTERKNEWLEYYPAMRNWQLVGPFATRGEAQRWEDEQEACLRSLGKSYSETTGVPWWGFRFDY
ncbi:MAG: hypothetical protein PVJ73_20210 [Acidobacteriota bacterium]|jgi:hypothetical protein